MDPRDREKLQRYYSILVDVMYSAISPHLISNFVLTLDMHEEIECRPSERRKMEKLLSILPTRGDRAMKELIAALKPSYSWIARKLESEPVVARRSSTNYPRNNVPDLSIADHLRELVRILQRSARVSTHWTFMANAMTLPPTTILDIKREMQYSGGHEYAIYAILEAWVTKVGNSRATFSKLISVLERESMSQSGEEVSEYWAEVSATSSDNVTQSRHINRRERSRSPVITDV